MLTKIQGVKMNRDARYTKKMQKTKRAMGFVVFVFVIIIGLMLINGMTIANPSESGRQLTMWSWKRDVPREEAERLAFSGKEHTRATKKKSPKRKKQKWWRNKFFGVETASSEEYTGC